MRHLTVTFGFIALFTFSSAESFGQKVLSESNNLRVTSHAYNDDREGGNENIYIVLENGVITRQPMRGGSQMYRFYDETLNLAYSDQLEPEEILPPEMTLSLTFKVGNEIYGLAYKTDVDLMLNELFLLEFDQEKFRFRPNYRTISTVAGEGYFRKFRNAYLDVEFSEDDSKILISHKLPERDDYISYRIITLDQNLDLIEEHDIEFEDNGTPFIPIGLDWSSSFEIDNDGTLYTYGHVVKDDENWSHCIIDRGRIKYAKMPGEPELKLYYRQYTQPKNAEGIWFMAEYTDKAEEVTGYMMQKMGVHGPEAPIFIRWGDQELGEYLQASQKKIDKYAKKGKHFEPENANLIGWQIFEDNSMLLVMERTYSVTRTDSKGNSSTTYYSMNLLVTRVDSKGKVLESSVVRKNQVSKNSSYQGSFVFFADNMLNIIFNDHISNIGPSWDGITSKKLSSPKGAVALIQMDVTDLGFSTKNHLWITEENNKLPILPSGHKFYKFQSGKYLTWCNAGAKRNMVLFEHK